MRPDPRTLLFAGAVALLIATPVSAQRGGRGGGGIAAENANVARLQVEPASLAVEVGAPAVLKVTPVDASGNPVAGAVARVSGGRGGLAVRTVDDRPFEYTVEGSRAGTFEVIATVSFAPELSREPIEMRVPVTVTWPPVAQVAITADPGRLFVGTMIGHTVTATHADGTERPRPEVRWTSSNPSVASIDRFGNVTAHAAGAVTISAAIDAATGRVQYTVAPLPATRLVLDVSAERVRTGDVVTLTSRALDASGGPVREVPVEYTFTFVPDDSINAPGAAGLLSGNRFVGEVPGTYTLLAVAGPLTARHTVDVRPREVVRRVTQMGQGQVNHVHTSDLWVYEGLDGRDYAVTGTWSADGWAYFWDVTDPSNIVKTDSIQTDARTVNDVKVSPSGRYAALSREGASNRVNGPILVDLKDPQNPVIASTVTEGITGGVHNMFATEDHLFALSGGDKYVIIDVRDLYNPKFVSEYNHSLPDGSRSGIHDVWVHDGIAYSSEWGTGVVVVDVGNGRWGGTIENPKFVTNVPYPVGRTHAAFPYHQESTGKFYLFLGDEIMSRGNQAWQGTGLDRVSTRGGTPVAFSGYTHIIDFTDPENPQDVARYEVKEFGTHNMWVEDDVLYQAYYGGGVRVVDVSGELLGNLADQGREIAVFKSYDPNGFAANAPVVWGAQPYKGHVFFSDLNSGLWAIRLEPRARDAT